MNSVGWKGSSRLSSDEYGSWKWVEGEFVKAKVYEEGTGNAKSMLESNGIGADVGRGIGIFTRSVLDGFGLAIQNFIKVSWVGEE